MAIPCFSTLSHRVLGLIASVCFLASAHGQENRGFTEGKYLGGQLKSTPLPTAGTINGIFPGFQNMDDKKALYDPNGSLNSAAGARKADCAINPMQGGNTTLANECAALNYLSGNSSRVADMKEQCAQHAQDTDRSKWPPQCQNLAPISISPTGSPQAGNPFVASINSDPTVTRYNSTDFADVQRRNGINSGGFEGCKNETLNLTGAKYNAQSCDARDQEIRLVRCQWSPTLGQAASCAHLDNNPLCEARTSGTDVQAPMCLQYSQPPPPDPKVPNPPPFTPVCLSMNTNYACASGVSVRDDTCGALGSLDRCSYVGSVCKETIGRTCVYSQEQYQCKTQDEVKRATVNCSGSKYCVGSNCIDTPKEDATRDMMAAVGTMEAVRQAGTYENCSNQPAKAGVARAVEACSPGNFQLFKGEANYCTKKLLKNCCADTQGTVKSNRSVMGSVIMAAVPYLGNEAVLSVSSYAYDFMYTNGLFTEFASKGLQNIGGEIISQSISTTYGSVFGITAWGGTTAPTGLLGNNLTQLGSIGDFNFAFDPYSLMFSIAIQVLIDQLSCTQPDYETNQKNAGRLCNPVGEFCSKRIPIIGTCYENQKSYCCYNSRLARIIQSAVGGSGGNAENPSCSGITIDQFSKLNFDPLDRSNPSRPYVDMSEFYEEIKPANFSQLKSETGQGVEAFTGARISTIVKSPVDKFAPEPKPAPIVPPAPANP